MGEKEDDTPCIKKMSWQVKLGQRCVYGDVAQPVDRIDLNLQLLLFTRNMEARCSLFLLYNRIKNPNRKAWGTERSELMNTLLNKQQYE